MLIFNLFSFFSKFFYLVLKIFNLGSGTTFISNIFLKFSDKDFSLKNFKFTKGIIFVTGTNGKSSTVKILSQLLEKTGYSVLHNETGGNILRSIVGLFLLKNKFFGKNVYDFLILEVDEGSIIPVSSVVKPTHLITLNFSRDQLDRYFEIENISKDLVKISEKNHKLKFIFNEEDEYCKDIAGKIKNEKFPFKKDFSILKKTNYTESFMASNLSAVITTLNLLGIKFIEYEKYLKEIKKPYGRAEKIIKNSKEFEIHLAKNPVSFNNNLIELSKRKNLKNFLLILNDNIPDGRDISWIYDIEPELLSSLLSKKKLYFSGTRAFEMANRVQFAVSSSNIILVEPKIKKMLKDIFEKDFNEVIILCNYSSMLEVRKILTGRKIL